MERSRNRRALAASNQQVAAWPTGYDIADLGGVFVVAIKYGTGSVGYRRGFHTREEAERWIEGEAVPGPPTELGGK
jgi:hypothetical protein